jgi:hypothetical protein
MTNSTWYRVCLPYACGAVVVRPGGYVITDSAPIFRWARGKPLRAFQAWVERKHGTIEKLSESLDSPGSKS